MNLNLFISALRARFGLFVLLLGVTVAAAVVVSLVMPKSYRATVSLLVDPGRGEQQSFSAGDSYVSPRERLGYIQTQMGILTSEKVVRRVVQDVRLADDPRMREAYESGGGYRGSIEDWLVEDILDRVKVESSQSNIIHLTYTSSDPQLAAQVANAFAKTFIDTVLELRVEPTRRAAVWFDEQLKVLRATLEDAQARLSAYQRKHGIISTDERLDVENARLTELSMQVMRVQDTALDWRTRERAAREAMSNGTLSGLPDVLNNPYVQRLNADLLAGEARLQEMSAYYGPNYPAYQRQAADNAAIKARLDAEMRKVVRGLESASQQSQQREKELRAAVAAQHARMLDLRQGRNELVVLTRNVESAQRTYEAAMQRFVINQVESRASQTNVNILDSAAVPVRPARPNIPLNVALAVVVGTMLGLGVATLVEMFDRRVRSGSDMMNDWNVPLLAALNTDQAIVHPLLERPLGGSMRALPKPA